MSAWTLRGWLARYESAGPKGLEKLTDGPRKPRGRPRLPVPVREEIASVKRRFPDFGLRKVRDFLARFAGLRVSTSSVSRTLREEGLPPAPQPRRRRRRRAGPPRRPEMTRPGEVWQSDITVLRLARADRNLYLVAFLDEYSRYVVSFGLHTHQKAEIVTEALLEGIARFGKPRKVLTDQGRQYYAWHGKSDFERKLAQEGIEHFVSRAHHPQTLGKCERFWETLKTEFWDRVMPEDLVDARERLAHWIAHYNHFRPHQGLGDGLVPADRFFGASRQVRGAIEKGISANEIRLALGERPRSGAYLAGQIGDQRVSIHGESGKLVVHTEDGGREELEMKRLGMPGSDSPEEEERDDDDFGSGAVRPGAGGGRGSGGSGAAAAAPDRPPEGGVCAPAAGPLPGAGTLGGGDGGGASPGAHDRGGDPGDLARAGDPGGGGAEALGAEGPGLAAQPAGALGDGGGAAQAAPGPTPGDAGPAAAPGGGSEVAAGADRGARGGPLAGEGPDRDPAGDAGAPGGAGGGGAAGEGPREEERCAGGEEGAEGSATCGGGC